MSLLSRLRTVGLATILLGTWTGPALTAEPEYPKLELREQSGKRTLWYQPDAASEARSVGEIERIPAGQTYFHWGPVEDVARWNRQGHVDAAELAHLRDGNGAAGGGFYVSSNPIDSMGFGPKALLVTMPREVNLLAEADLLPNSGTSASLGFPFPLLTRPGQDKLLELGISGVHYSPTWYNLADHGTLSRVREAQASDFLRTSAFDNPETRRLTLYALASRVRFDPEDPLLKAKDPAIAKVLAGLPLESAERMDLLRFVREGIISFYESSDLLTRTVQEFRPELREKLKVQLKPEAPFVSPSRGVYAQALTLGFLPTDLKPDFQFPKPLFESQTLHAGKELALQTGPGVPPGQSEYGKKLGKSFEFIGTQNILRAIATGNTEPWKLYDEAGKRPLLDRWLHATEGTFPDTSPLAIHRILSEDPSEAIRDFPIVAGGDIQHEGRNYFRATLDQKLDLERNPYLTLDILPDPASVPPGKGFLIRYEYPSAGTFEKFQEHLSRDLRKKLITARKSGKLANVQSPEFKALTREILGELLGGIKTEDPLEAYLRRISVHPFSDYNGRTFRAMYRRESGFPLYLRDWNLDLLLSTEEVDIARAYGNVDLANVYRGFIQAEKENPQFPRFFDRPELWQLGSEVDHEAVAKDPTGFVNRMKDAYRKPENQDLLRQKRILEFQERLQSSCPDLYKGLL